MPFDQLFFGEGSPTKIDKTDKKNKKKIGYQLILSSRLEDLVGCNSTPLLKPVWVSAFSHFANAKSVPADGLARFPTWASLFPLGVNISEDAPS